MVRFNVDVRVNPDQAVQASRRVERSLRRVDDRAQRVNDTLRRAFGAVAAALSARQIIQTANAYQSITNRLGTVIEDQQELNSTFEELTGIANRTRADLSSIATLYQRSSAAAQDLGKSQQEILLFTERIGEALAIQGSSASASAGALLQLSQALGSGIVRAEEFNSVNEAARPIVEAVARGLDEAGGSVSKLRNLIIEGEVTSKEFFEAFLAGSEQTSAQFRRTQATISQSLTVLNNNFIVLIGNIEKETGLFSGLAKAIGVVANNMDFLATIAKNLAILLGPRFLLGAVRALTLALAANPLGLLLVGISVAVAAIPDLQQKLDDLVGNVVALGQSIASSIDFTAALLSFAGFIDNVLAFFNGLLAGAGAVFDALGQQPAAVGELIKKGFRDAIEATLDFFFAFAQTVGNIIRGLGSDVVSLARNVGGAIGAISTGNLDAAQLFADNLESTLLRSANRVATFGKQFSSNLAKLRGQELLPEVQLGRDARVIGGVIGEETRRGIRESGTPTTDLVNRLIGGGDQSTILGGAAELGRGVGSAFVGGLTQAIGDPRALLASTQPPELTKDAQDLADALDVEKELATQAMLFNEVLAARPDLIDRAQVAFLDLKIAALETSTAFEDGFTRAFLRLQREAMDFAAVADGIVTAFADRATDALVEFAQTGELNFRDFANAVLEDIQRIIIRFLVVQALSAAFGGAGALFGGGAAGAIPGRQHGGRVHPNSPFVVGEGGEPEIFVPDQPGEVIPASRFGGDQPAPQVNVQVVNVDDPSLVPQTITNGDADEAILNVLSRNRDRVKQTLA